MFHSKSGKNTIWSKEKISLFFRSKWSIEDCQKCTRSFVFELKWMEKKRKFVRYLFFYSSIDSFQYTDLRRWMILLKLIYSILFLSLTIYSSLNESCEENIQYSNNNFIEIFDHWYSFVTVILLLSLFLDRLKRENFCSVQLFKAIDIVLLITFLLLVVIGTLKDWMNSMTIQFLLRSYWRLLSIMLFTINRIKIFNVCFDCFSWSMSDNHRCIDHHSFDWKTSISSLYSCWIPHIKCLTNWKRYLYISIQFVNAYCCGFLCFNKKFRLMKRQNDCDYLRFLLQ